MKDIQLKRLTNVIARNGLMVRILSIAFYLVLVTSGIQLAAKYFNWRSDSLFTAGAIFSLLVLSFVLFKYLKAPLKRMIATTKRIGSGELNWRIDLDQEDEMGQLASSINDMTEILEERLAQVSLLNQISRESTLSRNLNKVLDLILNKAIEMQKADAGSIMLVDEKNQELVIKVGKHLNPLITPETRVPINDGIAGWVAREGRPIVLVDGIGSDCPALHKQQVRNAVSLPILLDEKVVGVLNLSYNDGRSGKRFDPNELGFLTTLANHAAAAINNAQLFEELRANYFSTIEALVTAIDAKDPYTHGHSSRVAEYAMAMAKQMSMSEREIENVKAAAYLHDVGKIGIPEPILTKPGRLTKEEFEIIKTHPEISARILSPVNFRGAIVSTVRHHHERIDGGGYPDGLKGDLIPVHSRILSVADAYDAMTSARPYRPAINPEDAKEELLRCAGTQFDQKIVDAFLRALTTLKIGAEKPISKIKG